MLVIYQACCENVKEIKSKKKIIKKLINRAIKENNAIEVDTLTRVYALLYSAFAEVSFLKLIHTPHCFSEDQITQIQKQRNLEEKWNKCFELAFSVIENQKNLGDVANKKKEMKSILCDYIIGPSKIRNKLAHGQWKKCLNNSNDNINMSVTAEVQNCDFVKIDIYFHIYDRFLQCIEDLMESPSKVHYRDYYSIIVDIQSYIHKTKKWNLETKKQKLRESIKYSSRLRLGEVIQ